MVRLDFKRADRLSETRVGQLWDLIEQSRSNDRGYLEMMKELRQLHKTGTQGELANLSNEAQVIVNLAHSHVASLRPTLYFQEPSIKALPTHPREEKKAPVWKNLTNGINRRIGFDREAREVVADAITYPEGWLKNFIAATDQDDETAKPGKGTVSGATTEDNRRGPTEWLGKRAPAIARIAPGQVIVDYMSPNRSLENARFVDIMYVKTVSEVKSHPVYKIPAREMSHMDAFLDAEHLTKHAASNMLDPFALAGGEPWERGNRFVGKDHIVIIHECWVYQLVDLKLYRQLVVLVEGADGLMINKPLLFKNWEEDDVLGKYCNFYPITPLFLNEVPDMRPNSELGTWSSLAQAYNWIISRIVSFVDAEKQLWYGDEDKIGDKDVAIRAIQSGQSREIIWGKGERGLEPMSNQSAGRDNFSLLALVNDAIQRVGGIGENRQGEASIRTATEAGNLEKGVRIKIDDKRKTIAKFFKVVIEKQNKILRHIIEQDDGTAFVFRITGDTGDIQWLDFTKDDVNWFPEIDIEVHSFVKATRDIEVQAASMALESGMRLKAFHPEIRTDILYRHLLEKLEIPDIGDIIDNEQDHAMLQAAEIAMMMAGIDVQVNPGDNHVVHARVLQQFRNTEEWQQIIEQNPDAADRLAQHEQQHTQAIEKNDSAVQTATPRGQNAFADLDANPQGGSPANQARAIAGTDRETQNRLNGGGGQSG